MPPSCPQPCRCFRVCVPGLGGPRDKIQHWVFGGRLIAGDMGWHWVALPCHLVAVPMLWDRRAGSRAGAPNHVPIPEHPWRGQLPWVPSCLHSPCQKQLGAGSLGLRLTRCSPYLPARALHHPAGAFCSSPSDGRILGAVACRKVSHPSRPEPGAAEPSVSGQRWAGVASPRQGW